MTQSDDERRLYWRDAQRRSRERRRQSRQHPIQARRERQRQGRTFKIYCDSAKCRGHWVSLADLERERAAGRSYLYQRKQGAHRVYTADSAPASEPSR